MGSIGHAAFYPCYLPELQKDQYLSAGPAQFNVMSFHPVSLKEYGR
jgi:hypothetical protein